VLTIIIALLVIVALGAFALNLPKPLHTTQQTGRSTPQPWLVGGAAFVFSLLWFALIALAGNVDPALPVAIPLAGGIAWACVAFFAIKRWSACTGWQDMHRLALVFGALLASMLAGFLLHIVVLPLDVIGKLVLNVIAVLLLIILARRISRSADRA
jgi:hypothetical protein